MSTVATFARPQPQASVFRLIGVHRWLKPLLPLVLGRIGRDLSRIQNSFRLFRVFVLSYFRDRLKVTALRIDASPYEVNFRFADRGGCV
jgi:hypothetical protein